MMINVLPPEEKKSLRTEYYLRLSTICLFIVALLSFLAAFLLLPPYILSQTKVSFFQGRLDALSVAPVAKENDLTSIVTEINATLDMLHTGASPRDVSGTLSSILALRPAGVTFSQIFYAEQSKTDMSISVQGVAADRGALRALQSALSASPLVASADVPISDFTKRTNIDFSVTIKLK